MSERDALYTALRNAHKAGDVAAAKRLAAHIQSMPADKPKPNAGIGARVADAGAALVEGVFGLPDLAASGIGKGLGLVARAFGANDTAAALESPFTLGGNLRKQVPEVPGNAPARVVGNAVGGLAGGIGLGALIARGATGLNSAAAGVARELADKPMLQILGGLGGGAGVEVARGVGASVPVQIAAGIFGGGVAPGSVDAVASGGAAAGRAALRGPAYAREAAAAVLKRNTQGDPNAVGARILAAPEPTAGSLPTTAELAMDPGLAGFQRSLMGGSNVSGGAISERMTNNAGARRGAAVAAFGEGDVNAVPDLGNNRALAARQSLTNAVTGVGELVPPDVSGAELRALLTQQAAATKAAASARYNNIPGGDEPIQVGAVEPNFTGDLPGGPSEDTLAREAFRREGSAFAGGTEGRAFGAAAKPGQTLMGWVKSMGGINANSVGVSDLYDAGVTPKAVPGLFNSNRGSFTQGKARSNAGVMGRNIDELHQAAVAEGFMPEDSTADDFAQLLTDDFNANRVGSERVRPGDRTGASGPIDDGRDEARNWWGREFQDRNLDPERMTADDWDAMYRDVQGVDAPPVTQGDIERNAGGTALSPFQASIEELKRQYFPAGLPPASGVGRLLGDLTKADTLQAKEAERIVRDLRRQAGLLRASDGVSAGLAKAAANAAEGFVSASSGPARADALREARRFYRDDFKGVFANNEPGRVLATDQFGRPRLDDGNIPAVAVPTGRTGADAARRLAVAAGPDAAEKAAREELRRALDAAGPDAARIGRVASGYADTLRAYPELKQAIDRARDLAVAADTLAASPLAAVTKEGDPVLTIGKILARGDGGRDLVALARQVKGDQAATAGLRRALAENLERKATSRSGVGSDGEATAVNNALREGIDLTLKRTGMTGLLDKSQRDALMAIKRETDRAQFAATANRAPGSDTGRNADMWGNLLASVVAQGVPGGKGIKTLLDVVVSTVGRADAVRDLATQAMLDPKFAAELLMSPSPQRMKSLGERMQAYVRGSLTGSAAAAKPYSADRM